MKPMSKVSSDHDLLITLNTKVDNLAADMKVLGDGISQRVADHEGRIRTIEDVHNRVNPEGSVRRLDKLEKKVDAYVLVASVAGGIISFVITQLPGWIELILQK
jgi:hypothetical protein